MFVLTGLLQYQTLIDSQKQPVGFVLVDIFQRDSPAVFQGIPDQYGKKRNGEL